jgi:hypothetical protein
MIHSVLIDDTTSIGKQLLEELKRHTDIVAFKDKPVKAVTKEGFKSLDEFEDALDFHLNKAYGKI